MNHQKKEILDLDKEIILERISSSNKSQNGHFHHNNGNAILKGTLNEQSLSLEKTIQNLIN